MLARSSVTFSIVGAIAAQSPPEPKFVAGEVAALECRVIDARAIDAPLQLLTVEASNRGTVAAEPLTFRIEMKGKKGEAPAVETFARVQLPFVLRHGRPVPAGGKQTYLVPTALSGKKPQLAVTVVDASFHEGGVVGKPELRIGNPLQVQGKSLAGEFPVTQIALQNPFDRDVDVLMLVTLQQPKDTVELYGVRLAPGAKLDWVVAQRPGCRPYCDMSGGPGCAMKAVKFDVVDWCLAAPCPSDMGASVLKAAYESWYRWPDPQPVLGGAFVYRERRQRAGSSEYDDFDARGRFTVDADGKLAVDASDGKVDSGNGANPRVALQSALQNLRRPDFATLAKANKLVPVASDRVATEGKGWQWGADAGSASLGSGGGSWNDLQVAGGRIVSDGNGDGARTAWETAPMGDGWVVTRRHGPSVDERFSYGELDGRIVPTATTSSTTFGDKLYSSCELVLSDLRFHGVQPIAPVPPAGDGAAALRALWDAGHHYPTQPIELSAKFELSNPGTDLVWQGHKKLRGTLSMKGIGRRARDVDVVFDGELPPQQRFALAGMVRDRLLMWYGRDFGDRPAFDEFFAGATIGAPSDGGEFPVTNGRVAAVSAAGGLVRGWRVPGITTKLTWQQVGGVQAVVRVDEAIGKAGARSQDRWDSATTITLAKVGEHLLPAAITFERIFDRDWGPESLVLRDVKVR